SEVQIKLTLRDQDGNILYDHYLQVNHIKPYQIFIDELFPKYRDYLGNVLTVEVQVYFSSKPRFTYPAISLLVTDGKRNSVVHGGLRFYNPSEGEIK
ncbi:hypothetical protein EB169_09430, partial [archaeon]|nr:hypothetical protein [archaeon]